MLKMVTAPDLTALFALCCASTSDAFLQSEVSRFSSISMHRKGS